MKRTKEDKKKKREEDQKIRREMMKRLAMPDAGIVVYILVRDADFFIECLEKLKRK